jgi:hypothetical protein
MRLAKLIELILTQGHGTPCPCFLITCGTVKTTLHIVFKANNEST